MTDKEQIIIDGVDVSECVSFDKLNGQNICCYEDTREDKIPFANFCVENKDCYFKQLARKTQECEELKEKCEELKEDRYNLNMEMYVLASYRKALEEIKEIVSSTLDCGEWVGQGDDKMAKILDIIRRAKGEE